MRTTLDIADDVLQAAKDLLAFEAGRGRAVTVSGICVPLARQAPAESNCTPEPPTLFGCNRASE